MSLNIAEIADESINDSQSRNASRSRGASAVPIHRQRLQLRCIRIRIAACVDRGWCPGSDRPSQVIQLDRVLARRTHLHYLPRTHHRTRRCGRGAITTACRHSVWIAPWCGGGPRSTEALRAARPLARYAPLAARRPRAQSSALLDAARAHGNVGAGRRPTRRRWRRRGRRRGRIPGARRRPRLSANFSAERRVTAEDA